MNGENDLIPGNIDISFIGARDFCQRIEKEDKSILRKQRREEKYILDPEPTKPFDTTFNSLPPEVFQIIITFLLKIVSWRRVTPLRRVNKFWRDNIDLTLQCETGLNFTKIKPNEPVTF